MTLAIADYRQRGDVLYLPVPEGGVEVGNVYEIGALLVVATATASPGNMFTARVRGVFDVAKATGQAWAVGDRVYWDSGAQVFTTVSTANTFGGVCIKAALSADTRGRIRLGDSTPAVPGGSAASLIHQASVTLTDAQIKALPSLGREIASSPGANRFIVFAHGLWYLDTDTEIYTTAPTQASWQLVLGTVRITAPVLMGPILGANGRVTGAFVPESFIPLVGTFPNYDWFVGNVYTATFYNQVGPTDVALMLKDAYSGLPDYEDGHPDNSGWVAVEFRVFDVATRRFLTTDESGWDPDTRTFS